jgi:hypothetical protein
VLFQVSPEEKSIAVRPGDPDHTIGTRCPLHLLDVSRSTTAGHPPHSELELRRSATTTSASQLEAHLQAAPVEQFPENHSIAEQLACQIADRSPRQYP